MVRLVVVYGTVVVVVLPFDDGLLSVIIMVASWIWRMARHYHLYAYVCVCYMYMQVLCYVHTFEPRKNISVCSLLLVVLSCSCSCSCNLTTSEPDRRDPMDTPVTTLPRFTCLIKYHSSLRVDDDNHDLGPTTTSMSC